MAMRIVDAKWGRFVNLMVILCEREGDGAGANGCGKEFNHPANRWAVSCPHCHRTDRLDRIRERAGTIPERGQK